MKIADYIRSEIFEKHLQEKEILVVYNPSKLYRDICKGLESTKIKYIDASESSIISREEAQETLISMGKIPPSVEGMIIYIPSDPPLSEKEKQKDPFSIYGSIGTIFPDGDGEEYENICLKAKPDHQIEIRKIFNENNNPSFAIIDALDKGSGWPTLQSVLSVEFPREILFSLLVPKDQQKKNLKEDNTWFSEAYELLDTTLGMKVITRLKSWEAINDELWRFLLFSEFVFDLPTDLPNSLTNVPKAKSESRILVESICEMLRNDRNKQNIYIEKATQIENELQLAERCNSINDLGIRDTFPFEERSFLIHAKKAFHEDNMDTVREIIKHHSTSVWTGIGESQARWAIVKAGLTLYEQSEDIGRLLGDHQKNIEVLITFYITRLQELDRLHREFEQIINDYMDAQLELAEIINISRRKYHSIISKVHDIFISYFERDGWPVLGQLSNSDVFDKFITPFLKLKGNKIAFFQIDALRYELGVALEKLLSEENQTSLFTTCSVLPSVTNIGMSSLLPEAGSQLKLEKNNDKIFPVYNDTSLKTVDNRMTILKQKYGQRFTEMSLIDFIRTKKVQKSVELLVLRSNEMDAQMESSPETTLSLIHDTLKRVRVAINYLKDLGFNSAVIATDHGFLLNIQPEAGSVCAKPNGNWLNVHDRILLGKGSPDAGNFVMSADKVGIKGAIEQIASPLGLVAYKKNKYYFHGGISLQECILPVIQVKLGDKKAEIKKPTVTLYYKNNAKFIATRLPVIDVVVYIDDILLQDDEFEILLEAHDVNGKIVGEAKVGGLVNPSTGTISIKPNQRTQVTMKMQEDFEGTFYVKALNPETYVSYYELELKTDYMV